MSDELSYVHLDARQIRVLAHPLRARLLSRLRTEGPATATTLAEALQTNTGATSYHLRQLADVGLVIDEERAGSGRQRWWRAAHDVTSWRRSTYDDDPDAAAAAEWLEARQLNQLVRHAEAWRQASPHETPAWRDATELSDYILTLDAQQTRALLDELDAVIVRHRLATSGDPRPGARQVLVYLAAVPNLEVS
jgi:DNA-binding transcriptional ArsR family regulator